MKLVKYSEFKHNKNLGGKANSLLNLTKNGINVPKFFVIPDDFFKSFLLTNGIEESVKQNVLKDKYDEIIVLIGKATFSKEMSDDIYLMFAKLGMKIVSVRSSATNEDGVNKSFAGQYDTFLEVTKKELLEKIKLCWISLFKDNVVAYVGKENFCYYGMNVIVQNMINPNYAGVAFSQDPTSNSKNYSVIETCKGNGEKLVSGQVTPTKYIVRRETLKTDLLLGKESLTVPQIQRLENTILKIEKIYGLPVDIEWCFLNNRLYILQTRPITAFSTPKIGYIKALSREKSVIEQEIYFKREYEGIKKFIGGLYYFKPMFIYDKSRNTVDIYYNNIALEENPKSMFEYMNVNFKKTRLEYKKIKKVCLYLDNVMKKNKEVDVDDIINKMVMIAPFSSLGQLSGHFDACTKRVKAILVRYRNKYDHILYKCDEYILEKLKKELPKEYVNDFDFLTLEEVTKKKYPTKEEIKRRKKGYIYYDEKLNVVSDYTKWLDDNNISLVEEELSDLKGDNAYSGKVTGRVCKVFSEKDFTKFKEGDVLVTTMTTPKFTELMQIASAIVTDEGGVTCHASIVARELKKPCIIGCKSATKLLEDGMTITVDADNGKIVIKK